MKKILHIGLDVDDKAFHIGAFDGLTGEIWESVSAPNCGSLVKKIRKFEEMGYEVKACYEAGYLGFTLYRDLKKNNIFCEVISPSQIPRTVGLKVKTDRLDALQLARYYANQLLTPIHVIEPEQESQRDLIRSRSFLVEQSTSIRSHILSLCRRVGLDYRKDTENPTARHWTEVHKEWLRCAIGKVEQRSWQLNLSTLLILMDQLQDQILFFNNLIEEMSRTQKYEGAVKSLICYRGIDRLSAMQILTEIETIKRFNHPRKITSYAGMDIAEYSSGGKERKFGITKKGNLFLRTTAIESCQLAWSRPTISYYLKKRRKEVEDPKLIMIADRCMTRLYKKSQQMIARGKHKNKVKVACAREMFGFIWESLNAVGY